MPYLSQFIARYIMVHICQHQTNQTYYQTITTLTTGSGNREEPYNYMLD